MIVVVFRSRLKDGVEAELEPLGARMYELASAMPGFISYKDFGAEDGEYVTIVEFETLEHVNAWRDHPEHKTAQERGRSEFFQEYTIHVAEVIRTLQHAN
jgi:heme-degrading monooxygenase HmoA